MSLTEKIDELMALNGIKNKAELARLSGLPYTTIDGIYKKGSENLKLSTLKSLCRVLGCSLDELVTGKAFPDIAVFTEDDTALLITYHDLNSDGRQRLMQYAEELSTIMKYQKKKREDEDV